ncbi:MAG: hypothetical protein H6591_13965 [Flavobacteriales bacterium]|nr:hypothetical protein [Flavobacteriales bacterium]
MRDLLGFFLLVASSITACVGQPPQPEPVQPLGGTPVAEYVVTAFTDSQGRLWFGTIGHGVAVLDPSDATEPFRYLSPANGAGGNVVSSIAEDAEGNLWFAGHDGTGVVRMDDTGFHQLWSDESGVASDGKGGIWASTRSGVFRWNGERMEPFAVPVDRKRIERYAIAPGRVNLCLVDSRGRHWFRTDGYGLLRYDPAAAEPFTRFGKEHGLCSNSVNEVVEDGQGRIWILCMQTYQPDMTGDGGLCRMEDPGVASADKARFVLFTDQVGLHHNDLYTLFKDSRGALWIGATGTGVYRFADDRFTLYNQTDRPDLNGRFGLQGMTEDQRGRLWCGFSGGLFRLDGERFVHMPREGPWE